MRRLQRGIGVALALLLAGSMASGQRRALHEVNEVAKPAGTRAIAIIGATLIDGRGGPPLKDAAVIVHGERIIAVGARNSVPIPAGAEVVEAAGQTLLPGLIDSHFHLEAPGLPSLFLQHGVTSVRDPGQWIETYDGERSNRAPLPRLFLCGPHLDQPPPAYPNDSYLVRDADETRTAVQRFIEQGASAIKVYFRLPLGLIKVVTETAHARGVPVTAHLEIVDAGEAIRAGIDGVEHVTSFGTALLPLREAEKYRQSVFADNNARREGRYQMWSGLSLDSPRARSLFDLIVQRRTFVSPTLAVFERRAGDENTTEIHVRAFEKMLAFVGRARKAGANIVVGSHAMVLHAEKGWAYQREMELLVESGLTPMETITAATLNNARFFHIADRLGSVEVGKQADLLLLDGDPLSDIRALRQVKRVMLNGVWVPSTERK